MNGSEAVGATDLGLTLLLGPPSAEVGTAVLDAVENAMRGCDATGVVILVPSDRARDFFLDGLLARFPGGLFLPRIETLDRFVCNAAAALESGPRRLPDGGRRTLLAELIAELAGDGTLRRLAGGRDLPGVAQAIDHFFEALGRQRIRDPRHLESLILRYRQGRLTRLDEEITKLYQRWRGCLAPKESRSTSDGPPFYTLPDLIAELAEHSGALEAALAGTRLVVLHGFSRFSQVQGDLIRRLASRPRELLITFELPAEPDEVAPLPRETEVLLRQLRAIARRERWVSVDGDPVARAAWILMPGAPDSLLETRRETTTDRISLAVYQDPTREVQAVARQIARRLRGEDLEPTRIAVSFAEPNRYLPLVREAFPAYGIPFTADPGVPVAAVPPVALALSLLNAITGGFRRPDVEALLKSPYLTLPDGTRHPEHLDTLARRARVLGGEEPERDWIEPLRRHAARRREEAETLEGEGSQPDPARQQRLEAESREADAAAASLKSFFRSLDPLASARLQPISAMRFRELLMDALRALGTWQRSCDPISSSRLWRLVRRDTAGLRRLADLLTEMVQVSRLRTPEPRHELSAWVDRLRALLTEAVIRPAEEEIGGVRVVGLADLRTLPVDLVFIGGLTESNIPRRRPRELLYPETGDTERDFLLRPNPIEEDAAALFGEIARRRSVHLSWPRRIDGVDQLRSPLLDQLEEAMHLAPPPAPVVVRPPGERLCVAAMRSAADPPNLQQAFGPLLQDPSTNPSARATLRALAAETVRHHGLLASCNGSVARSEFVDEIGPVYGPGGRHVYAITEVETYARCPFAFFAERVLRLGELEEVEEEITPLTLGLLLHKILHRFCARLLAGEKTLSRETLDEARSEMRALAAQTLDPLPGNDLLWNALRDSICAGLAEDDACGRGPGVLAAFLASEIHRWEAGWRPIALEWTFGFPGHAVVQLATAGGLLRVCGRIDRIDRHPNGTHLVLDYKSGAVPSVSDVRHGLRFQLPLYLEACRAVQGPDTGGANWDGAYYSLSTRDGVRPRGFLFGGRSGGVDLQTVLDRLGGIARAISGGAFPLTILKEEKAGCRACAYRCLCRMDAVRRETRRTALKRETRAPVYLPEDDDTDTDAPEGSA